MRRCPRCHTSMIWATGDIEEGFPHLWHCLGCGRETLADEAQQAQDDRLREHLALAGHPRHERLY